MKEVFIHPKALVETDAVGEGTRVWAFAHILKGARVGKGCNICDHCFVEGNVVLGDRVTLKNGVALWDGVTIDDDAFIGPNAVMTNERLPRGARIADYRSGKVHFTPTRTRIGKGVTVGANATIVCGVSLGEHSFVGAGSVVTRDVPPHAVVYGVPARIKGYICSCGESLQPGKPCAGCGKSSRLNDSSFSGNTIPAQSERKRNGKRKDHANQSRARRRSRVHPQRHR